MMLLLLPVLVVALGGDAPAMAEGVRETQVTLSITRGVRRTQLQGTVVRKEGGTLTVLTAAHGLGPNDVGGEIRLKQGNAAATARVVGSSDKCTVTHPRSGFECISKPDSWNMPSMGALSGSVTASNRVNPWAAASVASRSSSTVPSPLP